MGQIPTTLAYFPIPVVLHAGYLLHFLLTLSPSVATLHLPFNIHHPSGIFLPNYHRIDGQYPASARRIYFVSGGLSKREQPDALASPRSDVTYPEVHNEGRENGEMGIECGLAVYLTRVELI